MSMSEKKTIHHARRLGAVEPSHARPVSRGEYLGGMGGECMTSPAGPRIGCRRAKCPVGKDGWAAFLEAEWIVGPPLLSVRLKPCTSHHDELRCGGQQRDPACRLSTRSFNKTAIASRKQTPGHLVIRIHRLR